jgi:hypothetical protein
MPTWASWSSYDGFLPKEFHTRTGTTTVLNYLDSIPGTPRPERDDVEQLLLLLGLTAREVWRSVNLHDGEPQAGSPYYMKQNPIKTEDSAHEYMDQLYGLSPFEGFKAPPQGVKRKADGNVSGARYVVPHCLLQVIEATG